MNRVRIKVCGTTRLQDAENAVKLGVDALGFIFFEKSKRNILPSAAAEIITKLPPFIDKVGVFVDESVERVAEIARECSLTVIQLHGKESHDYCVELSNLGDFKILKAFRVGSESKAEEFTPYATSVDGYLLDTYVKGAEGGTGKVFDWQLIENLNLEKPYLLAGGLTPENIIDALNTVEPYAVDINSGVEDAPGIKNAEKLTSLVKKVRRFELENLW